MKAGTIITTLTRHLRVTGCFRFEFDVTWLQIQLLEKIGLAWDLRLPSDTPDRSTRDYVRRVGLTYGIPRYVNSGMMI